MRAAGADAHRVTPEQHYTIKFLVTCGTVAAVTGQLGQAVGAPELILVSVFGRMRGARGYHGNKGVTWPAVFLSLFVNGAL